MGAMTQALLMVNTGAAGGGTTDILAAQVLEISKEESAGDVGVSPDLLQIEVFE